MVPHSILVFSYPRQMLQRQIECECSGTGKEKCDCHGEQEDVVIDPISEEFAIFCLECELDHEDDCVQECRELSEETDDEEQ